MVNVPSTEFFFHIFFLNLRFFFFLGSFLSLLIVNNKDVLNRKWPIFTCPEFKKKKLLY